MQLSDPTSNDRTHHHISTNSRLNINNTVARRSSKTITKVYVPLIAWTLAQLYDIFRNSKILQNHFFILKCSELPLKSINMVLIMLLFDI